MGLPQAAGGAGRTFDSLLGMLPEWVELTFFALIVLALLASWGVGGKRKLAKRRATRHVPPLPGALPSEREPNLP